MKLRFRNLAIVAPCACILIASAWTACSGAQVEGEPLRPGEITGDGSSKADSSSAEATPSDDDAAPTESKPQPGDWSAEEIVKAVEERPLPDGATGAVSCATAGEPPSDLTKGKSETEVAESVRAWLCAEIVGEADAPGAYSGDAMAGELDGVPDYQDDLPESAKMCTAEGGAAFYCFDRDGNLLAKAKNRGLGYRPEYVRRYDPVNTPDWSGQIAGTFYSADPAGERKWCRKVFFDYNGQVRYTVSDTDGDGQIDEGMRSIVGPQGQKIRFDMLESGEYSPRRRTDWDGKSFTRYEIDSLGKETKMAEAVTDGRGNVVRSRGFGPIAGLKVKRYDDAGRLIFDAYKTPDDEEWRGKRTWTYDGQGRLVTETHGPNNGFERNIQYGPHGPSTAKVMPNDSPAVTETWTYDEQGRMVMRRRQDGEGVLEYTRVEWDDDDHSASIYTQFVRYEPGNAPSADSPAPEFTRQPEVITFGCFVGDE